MSTTRSRAERHVSGSGVVLKGARDIRQGEQVYLLSPSLNGAFAAVPPDKAWVRVADDALYREAHEDVVLHVKHPAIKDGCLRVGVDTKLQTRPSRIGQFRKIVDERSFGKVDGVAVDLFSASAVVRIYDSLSPENQVKFESMHPAKMVQVAFNLMQ